MQHLDEFSEDDRPARSNPIATMIIAAAATVFLMMLIGYAGAECVSWAYDKDGNSACTADDLVNRSPFIYAAPPKEGKLQPYTWLTTTITSENYVYDPKPDITAYELALVLPPLFSAVALNGNALQLVEKLPPEARRHFRKQ